MFNLTQEERKVILFLAAIALLGIGANYLVKRLSVTRNLPCLSSSLGKINLNKADKSLLMKVSGIGEKLAQRIIEYRDKQEGFSGIEELKGIKGITETKFSRISEYLTVE